jgi:MFS family permease
VSQPVEELQPQIRKPEAPASRPIYYGWVVVAVCFAVMTLVSPLVAAFSVFYVAILQDLHWSRGNTAIAMSIYLVVNGLTAPFAGGLIDRFGPRRVMPVGALVTGLALAWLSQITSLWQFYVAFGVIAAMGCAMLHIVPLTTVVSHWFVRNRGAAIGIVTAGQGVGQVAVSFIQYLINRIGWRGAYLVLGAVIAVIPTTLILLFLFRRPADRGLSVEDETRSKKRRFPDDRTREGQEHQNELVQKKQVVILDKEWAATEWTVARAVRTFRFWALTLGMATFAAGFLIVSVQLVAYLTDKGYSSILAASVVSVQGFTTIVGRFTGGALSDRIGREKTLTLSVISFVTCLVLLTAGGLIVSPIIVYVFAIFYGMGSGMTLPVLMASAADLFQGKYFGSILGVITLGGFSGGAIGAWLGGYLFDLTHGYSVNFLAAALLMFVSGSLIWIARPGGIRLVRVTQAN